MKGPDKAIQPPPSGRKVALYESEKGELSALREELAELRRQYTDLSDCAPAGCFTLDGKGLIIAVNPFGEKMLGEEKCLLLNRPFARFVHSDSQEEFRRHRLEVIHEQSPMRCELKMRRKDGSLFYAALQSLAMENKPVLCRSIVTDITESRTAAEEFRRAKEELELRVLERTKELAAMNEQLIQSQKMEALGTLTGGIAHDFNNILTAIVGFSSLLRLSIPKDSELFPSVEGIIISAEKASFLTRQLLLFSKKSGMTPHPLELNSVIRKAEHLLMRLMPRNISLSFIPSKEELTVTADSTQLDQVLINLAVNARDAMPDGGSLTFATSAMEMDDAFIRTHGFGASGSYACISVADSGKGMDEKTKERIFEPFFTTKEVGKGTGLGLAVVYGIIKGHHGYIEVSSGPNKGTTFRIYLPLTEKQAESASQ